MKNNPQELKAVLEEIRATQYPDVPPEVLDEIISAQIENQDNPGKRQSETIKIIMKYADMITGEEASE